MTNDGSNVYAYDAEGNVTAVNGGSTAAIVYDALNHKVRTQTAAGTYESIFDANCRGTSNWVTPTFADEGHTFWDNKEIAFRSENGQTFFEHKDWLQTDRMHTDPAALWRLRTHPCPSATAAFRPFPRLTAA
jgi:hypothetical protein